MIMSYQGDGLTISKLHELTGFAIPTLHCMVDKSILQVEPNVLPKRVTKQSVEMLLAEIKRVKQCFTTKDVLKKFSITWEEVENLKESGQLELHERVYGRGHLFTPESVQKLVDSGVLNVNKRRLIEEHQERMRLRDEILHEL